MVYAVLLAWAVFWPSSGEQNSMVHWLEVQLRTIGLPWRWTTFGKLEIVMNAVIVAPLTFLAAIVKPSWKWRDWTALGFVVSSGVELTQLVFLSGRHASFSDVVANTAGALLGALLAQLLRLGRR